MKKASKFLVTILIGILIFATCFKDDIPDPIITLSNDKQITSFVFLPTNNPIGVNVIGLIDENAKTITAIVPPNTNISGLLPEIKIPTTAEVSPNTAKDFTNPIATYTRTAEDGSEVVYTATVTILLSQKEILLTILDVNPSNTLNWDLPNTVNLGTLSGVTTDVEGNIVELNLSNGDLTTVPPEIELLTNLTLLSLHGNNLISIPAEIGNLPNLTALGLGRNNLTSIPNEIGNLTNLTELDLYKNSLTEIPAEIRKVTNFGRNGCQVVSTKTQKS